MVSMVAIVVGCATGGAKRDQAITPAEYKQPKRIACVGDSITFGESIKLLFINF